MIIKNKTEQIVDYITNMIKDGALCPGDQIGTELQLQKQFSVSRIIIRRVLGKLQEKKLITRKINTGAKVSDHALIQIHHDEEKQSRDSILKIAFVLHEGWTRDAFFIDIIKDFESKLMPNIELKVFFHSFLKKKEYLKENIKILILDHGYSDDEIASVNESSISKIVLLRNSEQANYIASDEFDAGYSIGKYLFENGHKNIAYFNYVGREDEWKLRLQGLMKAKKEFNFETVKVDINRNIGITNLRTAVDFLISSDLIFSAIVALDDIRAYQIFDQLENKGVSIPDDVSLTGFGNIYLSSKTPVPLTTVNFPFTKISDHLICAVKQYLQTGKIEITESIQPRIIERASVKNLSR